MCNMSDSLAMSEDPALSPSANTSTSLCTTKGLNLSGKDFPTDQVSEVYKNNNNNIVEDSVSPRDSSARDVSNYSVESHLASDKEFTRRESFVDECKMNISPKERGSMEEDENMHFSPKSTPSGRRSADMPCEAAGGGGGKFISDSEYSHQHHPASLAANLQKRPIFNADMEDRDQDDPASTDYGQVNQDLEARQRTMEQPSLQHEFGGRAGSEQNEEMSDNEMMTCDDDYESDSESNEPRITVREALMNRALAAAAAAAAAAGNSVHTSHYGSGTDRSGEQFSSEQGGSGRTSRSGGVSPSSPGLRSSSTSGIASGRNEINSSNNSSHSQSKEPFINGHASLRPPVSHSHSGERYPHVHGHHQPQSHSHSRSSYGAHHGQSGHSSSRHGQHYRDPIIKSESKSHSSSPLQSEVKPENLAALSNLSNIQSSIGNALLNLASLGSLAALQQSLPGLLSSVGSSSSGMAGLGSSSVGDGSRSSPSHTSPQTGGSSSSPSASSMNAPLNLTHATGGSAVISKSHHLLSGNTGSGNSGHSRGLHSSSPSVGQFSHQSASAFSHCNSLSGGSPSSLLSSSGGLIPPNLAAYFSQSAGASGGSAGSGSGSSPFIPNASQLTNTLSHAAAGAQSPGSLPQLVLASGQIMQGIQGAQLLIPTSQGVMTQMILTIPLTQPGSPQSIMNASAQSITSPAIGASGRQSSSSPHSRSARNQGRSHHHGLPLGNANSPPIASTVPPSNSPDYSGPGGTIPTSLLNISPHLVNQSLGAHIPLDKMGLDRGSGINGVRSSSVKRDSSGSVISSGPNLPMSSIYPPKMSPCSGDGHDSDKCSEGGDSDQMVDGINLDEIKEFAKAFKLRRLSLGLTQTQVGQALSVTEGPAYSQSAICSALAWQLAQSQSQLSQSNRASLPQPPMFEKLDITPKSAQKIKPVLERWMKEAEDRYKNGHQNLNEFVGMEPSKKRKRRTSFTPQALEILNTQFERNTHPSGAEITTLAHQLGYEREVIRIWFCNKRQALKNTVRMMSKGSSPI